MSAIRYIISGIHQPFTAFATLFCIINLVVERHASCRHEAEVVADSDGSLFACSSVESIMIRAAFIVRPIINSSQDALTLGCVPLGASMCERINHVSNVRSFASSMRPREALARRLAQALTSARTVPFDSGARRRHARGGLRFAALFALEHVIRRCGRSALR